MSNRLIIISAAVFFLSIMFCNRITDPISRSQFRLLTPEEGQIVTSDNSFGLKLFREIAAGQSGENIFISPLSVSMALGMTLNGADGSTREAMMKTLELNGMSQTQINQAYQSLIQLLHDLDQEVIFQIANSIWHRNSMTFEQDFIAKNKEYFNARVEALDFDDPESVNIINGWVNESTHGKISKIIEMINPFDIMYLINAIYFKGSWTYEFAKELTRDDIFTKTGGAQVDCKMMIQENEFNYLETDELQAVDLPYGNGQFRFTLFLPKPDIDPDEFIAGLSASRFYQWLQKFSVQKGLVEIPKFELKYELTLNSVLTALGMGIAFDATQANFRRMYQGPPNAFIDNVLHKTYVKLDEEGTEAAAVTVVTIGTTSVGGSSGFHLRADRPFIFVIRENHSNTMLFMGKIAEPVWES